MRARPILVLSIAALASATVAAIAFATSPPVKRPGIATTLTQIREVRVNQVVPLGEDEFVFPHDKPGLFLKFEIAVPEGLSIVEIEQPTTIVARDTSGADLSQIEESFMNRKDYIELQHVWGDESPNEFVLTLAKPTRTAKQFTVATQFDATLFAGTETTTVHATSEWQELPASLTDGKTVRFRLGGDSETTNFEIQPGTAKDIFEKIVLKGDGEELESMGSMWSDNEATFFFQGARADSMEAAVTVRTGLSTMPVQVQLADVPLP